MKRNTTIDFFRGLFLLIMMVDHLQLFAFESINDLLKYTHESFGYISAAEGFIFISGLMTGLVYCKKFDLEESMGKNSLKSRIFQIYKMHFFTITIIAFFFIFPDFVNNWDISWENKLSLWKDNPQRAWITSALFLYHTSFVDVLPLYVLLMCAAYFVIPFLLKEKHKSVFILSILLWIFGQFKPQEALGNHIGFLLGWFEVLSWQLLFLSGIYFGNLYFKDKLPKANDILFFTSLAIAFTFFTTKQILGLSLPTGLVNVRTLGIFRLINFFSLLYIFYYLYIKKFFRPSFSIINVLGRNSLNVFAVHLVIVYISGSLKPFLQNTNSLNQYLLFFICIFGLYIPIIYEKIKKIFSTRKISMVKSQV